MERRRTARSAWKSPHELKTPYELRSTEPAYWFNRSSDLRAAAGVLWASMEEPRSAGLAEELGLGAGFSLDLATRDVYLMLCGLSLELLFKAIAVAQGRTARTSHGLLALARDAGVEYDHGDRPLLELLDEHVVWAGRYPVPRQKRSDRVERARHLAEEVLWKPVPLGDSGLTARTPNPAAADWGAFTRLWSRAFVVYRAADPAGFL